MQEQRNYVPQMLGELWLNLTAGMLLIKLTFFPQRLHSNSNSSTVFCFTEQNLNSVSFSQSQCCRLLKVLLSRFSSEVDVVLGEVVHHKFRAHHYWSSFLMSG